jgi:hypothetical protein
MKTRRSWVSVTLVLVAGVVLALSATFRRQARDSAGGGLMVGAKIYEYSGSFPALFEAWRETGINTAFVSPALISNPEFRGLAKKNGVATFIIFPVFFNAEELARRPDLYAVTDKGARAEEDWVKFVCPTRPDYLAEKIEELRKLIRETDPEGISLDFIRFFVFWEMVYPDLALLAPLTDYISPMCYHHMVKQTPAWVHSVVEDVERTTKAAVIPSIQVKEAYIPGPESAAEFKEALTEALKPPSRGVVFWNWPALEGSPEKREAVKAVLRSLR